MAVVPHDRSVNDRVPTKHARLMKGGTAGEITGSGRLQCTHVITVASRVTHSHSPVETPSHAQGPLQRHRFTCPFIEQ